MSSGSSYEGSTHRWSPPTVIMSCSASVSELWPIAVLIVDSDRFWEMFSILEWIVKLWLSSCLILIRKLFCLCRAILSRFVGCLTLCPANSYFILCCLISWCFSCFFFKILLAFRQYESAVSDEVRRVSTAVFIAEFPAHLLQVCLLDGHTVIWLILILVTFDLFMKSVSSSWVYICVLFALLIWSCCYWI